MSNDRILRQIKARLSLRPPQADSLDILDDILDRIEFGKHADPVAALAAIQAACPSVTDFERDFASLCFALATGVGKTRLMGAFISYLYLSGRSRNFFVLAPRHRGHLGSGTRRAGWRPVWQGNRHRQHLQCR
jgi:type III restriction enzyme